MLDKLKKIGQTFKRELQVYRTILQDKRTPVTAKILLAAALGYTLMPFDLIPDWIPIIGYLDDAIIVPLLVFIALKFIPDEVIQDCRQKLCKRQVD